MAIATRNNGDMDMMLLPEQLLVDIASCLPFKEATKTSVLCKGWSNIWKSTKNIEFNELFFVKPGVINKETQRRVFLNFITHFLANYKGNKVDKFSLKVSNPQTCDDTIHLSVSFATHHGVGLRSLIIDKCHLVNADYLGFRTPNLKFLKYSGLMGLLK